MLLGLFVHLTIVNDQTHRSGDRFRHKKTRATMAGIVHVFLLLDKASIYTFLDLALNPVNLVLFGRIWMPSYHRPFKL